MRLLAPVTGPACVGTLCLSWEDPEMAEFSRRAAGGTHPAAARAYDRGAAAGVAEIAESGQRSTPHPASKGGLKPWLKPATSYGSRVNPRSASAFS